MEEANAQTQIIEKDISRVGERITETVHRLDRHLEIYAQNGKELAALKTSVELLRQTINERRADADIIHRHQDEQLKGHETAIQQIQIDISKIATRIGMYSAAGASVASAVIGITVNLLFNV